MAPEGRSDPSARVSILPAPWTGIPRPGVNQRSGQGKPLRLPVVPPAGQHTGVCFRQSTPVPLPLQVQLRGLSRLTGGREGPEPLLSCAVSSPRRPPLCEKTRLYRSRESVPPPVQRFFRFSGLGPDRHSAPASLGPAGFFCSAPCIPGKGRHHFELHRAGEDSGRSSCRDHYLYTRVLDRFIADTDPQRRDIQAGGTALAGPEHLGMALEQFGHETLPLIRGGFPLPFQSRISDDLG